MNFRGTLALLLVTALLAGCAIPAQWTTVPQTQVAPAPVESRSEQVAATPRTDLEGRWDGAITIMGMQLGIVVNFSRDGEQLTGTIDIPQQGASGIALHSITFDAPEVRFEMLEGPQLATFEGALEAGVISGIFTQSGIEGAFELVAVDAELAEAAPPASEEIYEDPSGLFTVSVPTNWTVEEGEGYGLLLSPGEGIRVYVLTVPAESALEGIDAAWELVDPDFDLERQQVQEAPPSRPGIEETYVVVYRTGDDNRLVMAGADLLDGIVYVQIVDADLVAFQQRISQVQIIGTGWTFTALDDEDLAGVEPLTLTDEMLAELEAYIIEKMEQLDIPGAAVAIVQDGEIVYAEGFGSRGPNFDEPITPETHFMIGSTGKTLTTMLMAALVDAGLMDWDTPVVEILPGFAVADPELTQMLTVRNLVCACTGVPRRDLEAIFNAHDLIAEDVVRDLQTYEFFTDFGEAFQYSNQMVATGGYAAGAAAGGEWGDLYNAYAEALQAYILDPMGMENTTLSFDAVLARENYAEPFGITVSGDFYPLPLEMEELLTPIAPAGAHWSTVMDMGRYLITELAEGVSPDGTRVVSVENLAETWQPQIAITADASYGLGWIVDSYKGVRVIQHGGNTFGFTSELAFVPEAGVGISVVTNGRATNLFNTAVRIRLLEMVYDQDAEFDLQVSFLDQHQRDTLAQMANNLGEVDEEAVALYLGRYSNEALGEIVLEVEDGRLFLDAGEFRSELRPNLAEEAREGQYMMYDGPLATTSLLLQQTEAGEPIVVLGSGVAEYRFEMVD
jgi:CubicO group peptidase (beta-lactamase class C family)